MDCIGFGCLGFGIWDLGAGIGIGIGIGMGVVTLSHSAFGIWNLAFGVWHLAFGVGNEGVSNFHPSYSTRPLIGLPVSQYPPKRNPQWPAHETLSHLVWIEVVFVQYSSCCCRCVTVCVGSNSTGTATAPSDTHWIVLGLHQALGIHA